MSFLIQVSSSKCFAGFLLREHYWRSPSSPLSLCSANEVQTALEDKLMFSFASKKTEFKCLNQDSLWKLVSFSTLVSKLYILLSIYQCRVHFSIFQNNDVFVFGIFFIQLNCKSNCFHNLLLKMHRNFAVRWLFNASYASYRKYIISIW